MAGNGSLSDSANDQASVAHGDEREFSTMDVATFDRLTMEATVDISDVGDEDKRRLYALAELFEDAFMEVAAKNRDYGWSFLNTGQKLAESDGTPFDSAVRSQAYGLLTRSGDKRERLIENVYGQGDASVSDEPWETAVEMANYAFFLALILKHPELAKSISDSR